MAGYKFSGIDIESACGFYVGSDRASSNSIEKPASVKTPYTHNWGDENGTEIDISAPIRTEARKFVISGTLLANSESEYRSRKQALTAALYVPYIFIYQPEINETVVGKFTGFSSWERLTQVKGANQIVTKITMEFDEVTDVALPVYDVFFGPSSAVPITEADVVLLNQAEYALSGVVINTGTDQRIINIVKRATLTLTSVVDDEDSEVGELKDLFELQSTLDLDGESYDVLSMINTAPFLTNRKFRFFLA